ncbi:MAG: type II toxin-antitoxin system HicA family toxin [Chloroflexi bacterium]|nr:type II toxin-antitoxin system HicA family toxin [Chloroflexota bacterium]
MTYGEFKRRLARIGVQLVAQGKRHEQWYHPATRRFTWIPRHRGEVPTGLYHRMLRDLGLREEDLA